MLQAAIWFSSFPWVPCVRVRVRVPEPQESVHDPQSDQSAHPSVVISGEVVGDAVVAGDVVISAIVVADVDVSVVVDVVDEVDAVDVFVVDVSVVVTAAFSLLSSEYKLPRPKL